MLRSSYPSFFIVTIKNYHVPLFFSDILIAQSQTPKDVEQLAREVRLLPEEVDLYGKKKAKVSLKVLDRLSSQKDGRYVVVTGWAYLFFFIWDSVDSISKEYLKHIVIH